MKKESASVKKLEVGKDYVNLYDNDVVVFDRVGDIMNRGFQRGKYKNHLGCTCTSNWREATDSEVIEAFEKHLLHRFGEDWETMKIKKMHPNSNPVRPINDNSYGVEITKFYDGWVVWNENGLLYCNGIWVEGLKEPTKPTDWTPAPEDIEAMNKSQKASNYRLKQWYPSLYDDIEVGTIVDYEDGWIYYTNKRGNKTTVEIDEGELSHKDFWELIEDEKPKPLFITEDGVDKFYSNQPLWEVNKDFEKLVTTVAWVASKGSKYFAHEGNADKYIEDHKPKPLFITDDGVELFDEADKLFIVNKECYKKECEISNIYDKTNRKDFKYFFHESNADEYIWRNKPVFSYEDFIKWGNIPYPRAIEQLAKERSKQ